jgi:cell division septation protein DedD
MEQPQTHEPVRDTRTIRNVAPHHPMRPFVLGIGVVALLGGAIVLASRYERAGTADPAALVTPGGMHVEQTEVLPPGLAPAPKPEADARGTGPVPVKFYEVLEKGSQATAGGGDIAMRSSMPLPPTADDAKAAPQPAAEAVAPAPVPKAAPAQSVTAPVAPPQKTTQAAPQAPAPQAKPVAPQVASAAPTGPPSAVGRPYTLQVGSFSDKGGAQDLVGRLKGKGHEAYLTAVDLGAKGTWYRVRVGRFPTEHAAKWARLDLVREGLSPIVVHDTKGP